MAAAGRAFGPTGLCPELVATSFKEANAKIVLSHDADFS